MKITLSWSPANPQPSFPLPGLQYSHLQSESDAIIGRSTCSVNVSSTKLFPSCKTFTCNGQLQHENHCKRFLANITYSIMMLQTLNFHFILSFMPVQCDWNCQSVCSALCYGKGTTYIKGSTCNESKHEFNQPWRALNYFHGEYIQTLSGFCEYNPVTR